MFIIPYRKFLKIGLVSILFLFVFQPVLAMENQTIFNSKNVVATSYLSDSEIEYLGDNAFQVKFQIGNKDGVQPGIKYGIELAGQDLNIYDIKVFDEKLNLGPGQILSRTVKYKAPDFFDGEFLVWLKSYNEDGLPLGINKVGYIDFERQKDFIYLNPNNCYFTVNKDNERYKLNLGVDIAADDSFYLHCTPLNNFSENKTITNARLQIFERTVYGKLVDEKNLEISPLTIIPSKNKEVVIEIPHKDLNPQAYDSILTLLSKDGASISNKLFFHFVVPGESATIKNIIFNKPSYKAGDTAEAMIYWAPSADIFPDSRYKGSHLEVVDINLEVRNQKGDLCADPYTVKAHEREGVKNFVFSIKSNCADPQITLVVKNKNGKNLVVKHINLIGAKNQVKKTDKKATPEKHLPKKTKSNMPASSLSQILFFTFLVFLALILLFYFFKKQLLKTTYMRDGKNGTDKVDKNKDEDRKRTDISKKNLMIIAFLGGSLFVLLTSPAYALTFRAEGWQTALHDYIVADFVANTDKSNYLPGERIVVSGSGTNGYCSNGYGQLNLEGNTLPIFMFGWCDFDPTTCDPYVTTGSLTTVSDARNYIAELTAGLKTISLKGSSIPPIEANASLNYNVVLPTVCTCNSCTDCTTKLDAASNCDIVKLQTDIIDFSGGTCIDDPNNKNKIFDCQGHIIDGKSTNNTYGIYLEQPNQMRDFTIRNCKIKDFHIGIYLNDGNYSNVAGPYTLDGNEVTSCKIGIFLDRADNIYVLNNKITDNSNTGIFLENIQDSYITNNIIQSNQRGLYAWGDSGGSPPDPQVKSSRNYIENNNISNNINEDLSLGVGTKKNHVNYNNFCGSGVYNIYNDGPTGINRNRGDNNTGDSAKIGGVAAWDDISAVSPNHFVNSCAAIITGQCGPADGVATYSLNSSDLCSEGVASIPTLSGTDWTWDCLGTAGNDAHCSAPLKQDGQCGTAARTYSASEFAFSGNFCDIDDPPDPNPSFPPPGSSVQWTCEGVNGGVDKTDCTAVHTAPNVDGECGSNWNSGNSYLYSVADYPDPSDATAFCSKGTLSTLPVYPAFPAPGGSESWICNGSGTGSDTTCVVTHDSAPILSYEDIGLRVYDGANTITIAAVDNPDTAPDGPYPLRISKKGKIYGIALVDPGDPDDSGYYIRLNDGTKKALKKL